MAIPMAAMKLPTTSENLRPVLSWNYPPATPPIMTPIGVPTKDISPQLRAVEIATNQHSKDPTTDSVKASSLQSTVRNPSYRW